jgi:hypothetical protein
VLTLSTSRFAGLTQLFESAHRGRVYVRVFTSIEVSLHIVSVCMVLCNSQNKKTCNQYLFWILVNIGEYTQSKEMFISNKL